MCALVTFKMLLTKVYGFFVLTLFVSSSEFTASYKILCVYPTISRSHFIVAEALMIGLAEAGHNVTVVSPYPPDKPISNYRFVRNPLSELHSSMMKQFTENAGDFWTIMRMIPFFQEFIEHENESLLKNEEFRQIMQAETFDLVVYEGGLGEFLLGLSAHFNCPSVLVTSLKPQNIILKNIGNPLALPYISNILLGLSEPMDFTSRVANFLYHLVELGLKQFGYRNLTKFHNKHFPAPKYPPFNDVYNNISAVFVSDHISQKSIRPLLPNIIQIGGVQIKRDPKQMRGDLKKWMDESTNGVIYFSLGSNIKSAHLKPETLKQIFDVFGSLNENVLMKLDLENIAGLPKNIRIGNWLPQVEVLAHKNCKLFVSHAGLGSITEARYFGVPLLTVPIFGDQMANSRVAVREGLSIELKLTDLNDHTLSAALDEALNNPKYRDEAKYQAELYIDRPQTALATGVYWIEYIIRHKGATHMRSNSIHLNFFQLHSLDVIAFLSIIIITITHIGWRLIKCLVCSCSAAKKFKTQ